MKGILVSWVGEEDLGSASGSGKGKGPLAQAIAARELDEIHLLSTRPRSEATPFLTWLWERTSVTVVPHFVTLPSDDPTDFRDVLELATTVVQSIADSRSAAARLVFNLSSGTSAAAAAWIVLGRTRFPADLIQSSRDGGVETVHVPFDISAEYIASADRILERGVAREAVEPVSGDIAYQSPAMAATLRRAERVALSDVAVLLEGEAGVQKEGLARSIHDRGARAKRKFREFNCGAFPADLIESILFGSEGVAFAREERRGEVEKANGSTIFLDEISEMPARAQTRFLRLLLDGEITRVGGRESVPVSVRIITGTSCDLAKEVAEGRFREDLFYLLSIATIRMPPIRETKADLPGLIDHVLDDVNRMYAGLTPKRLSPEARTVLLGHPWPGNEREICNTLARLVVWSEKETISSEDVRQNLTTDSQPGGGETALVSQLGADFRLEDMLDEISRSYIERALEETNGVKSKAVELLGMSNATTLTNWMKRLGLKAGSRK